MAFEWSQGEIMIIQAISIKTIGGNPLFEDLSCQIEAGENCLSRYQRNWQINLLQILTGREGVDSGVISRKRLKDRDGRTRTYSFRSDRQPLLAPFCR